MIISASRRTDIPAFYSDWFWRRIEAGFCLVPNPRNAKQVSRVSLRSDDVDAIVFWTKNPRPILRFLPALEERGYRFYFQFTVNDYPKIIEPHTAPLQERIAAFRDLSALVGPRRVIWRYDPIVLSSVTDLAFHLACFEGLCSALRGLTRRVVISVVDLYAKVARRLRLAENTGVRFDYNPTANQDVSALLERVVGMAEANHLEVFSCSEACDYSRIGIRRGSCIDGNLIAEVWGIARSWRKDPGQREQCGCVASRDIGMNDTCPNECLYCYACQDQALCRARFESQDPRDTALIGSPEPTGGENELIQKELFA